MDMMGHYAVGENLEFTVCESNQLPFDYDTTLSITVLRVSISTYLKKDHALEGSICKRLPMSMPIFARLIFNILHFFIQVTSNRTLASTSLTVLSDVRSINLIPLELKSIIFI